MVEDTRINEIEEMLRDAEKGQEPVPADYSQVLDKGDETGTPMIALRPKSAGYSIVYDTKTFEPSLVNNNMLPRLLRKKREDGTYVFGLKQLGMPRVGTFKCLLHQDDPNRKYYGITGLAVCPKDNLASPFQVRRHMLKKHKVEWDQIEDERKEKEKQEDRDFQRHLIGVGKQETKDEKPPLYVSAKDKAKMNK